MQIMQVEKLTKQEVKFRKILSEIRTPSFLSSTILTNKH